MTGRQSFNRGITIMKMLAANGSMTASSLARELGLNQSSVSRLLQSLISAGFVQKPSFHKFALDYGVLTFAGIAMDNFPLTSVAARVCNTVHDKYGCGAAVAVLHEERLLYMAFISEDTDSRLKLIDDSSFPIHESSLGLVLSYAHGKNAFNRIISKSINNSKSAKNCEKLYKQVDQSIKQHGIFYLSTSGNKGFNASIPFCHDGHSTALAIFNYKNHISKIQRKAILKEGLKLFEDNSN